MTKTQLPITYLVLEPLKYIIVILIGARSAICNRTIRIYSNYRRCYKGFQLFLVFNRVHLQIGSETQWSQLKIMWNSKVSTTKQPATIRRRKNVPDLYTNLDQIFPSQSFIHFIRFVDTTHPITQGVIWRALGFRTKLYFQKAFSFINS